MKNIKRTAGLYLFHIRLEELQEIEKLYFSKNIAAKKIIEQEKEALNNKQGYMLYPVQTWQLYFYSRYRLKSLRMSVLKQRIEAKITQQKTPDQLFWRFLFIS
ncbi:hypothetical protein [Enterococcus faecalis]|uniref:hypothetical protein n=1 Tax=Enterococcus faecalis TaxID=1351 RepID=UPI001F5709D1|nr:hypothetical protein [Enterococcus faecalis]